MLFKLSSSSTEHLKTEQDDFLRTATCAANYRLVLVKLQKLPSLLYHHLLFLLLKSQIFVLLCLDFHCALPGLDPP